MADFNCTPEGGRIKDVKKADNGDISFELDIKGLEGKLFSVPEGIVENMGRYGIVLSKGDRIIADFNGDNVVKKLDVYRSGEHLGTYSGFPLIPRDIEIQTDDSQITRRYGIKTG